MGAPLTSFVVGQAPSRTSSDPLRGRSGDRLAALAGLSGYEELTAVFAVGNLLPVYPGPKEKGDHFDRELARRRALSMHELLGEECWDRVLLLGRNVAWAFGLADAPYLRWLGPSTGDEPSMRRVPGLGMVEVKPRTRRVLYEHGEWLVPTEMQHLVWPDARFAVLPHPSGVSRWWNDAANADAARRFLRSLVRESTVREGDRRPVPLAPED